MSKRRHFRNELNPADFSSPYKMTGGAFPSPVMPLILHIYPPTRVSGPSTLTLTSSSTSPSSRSSSTAAWTTG